MFRNSTSTFDRLLEKATSHLLLEPDWDSILQICDLIRQGDVPPKHAALSVRKKVAHENPNVGIFALQCLESMMKNCGSFIHDEVATKDFMEFLRETAHLNEPGCGQQGNSNPVKEKVLELIQVWAQAFRTEPKYKACQDAFNILKMEGHAFPQLREADAMFASETAPEWKDGECCHRCRVPFSTFQRKHHCRACGQVFCSKCSSKSSIIPKFGIEKEVRVCDSCFDQLNKSEGGKSEDDLPEEYVKSPLARQSQMPGSNTPPAGQKSEKELEQQEQEELALALALSQSEAEAKSKERERMKLDYNPYGGNPSSDAKGPASTAATYAEPAAKVTAASLDTSDMDPDLARYLNRNYWEQKSEEVSSTAAKVSATQPSAPAESQPIVTTAAKTEERFQNGEADADQTQFFDALQRSVEIFVNRMRSNSSRGRSIANDSSVQSLFQTINAMHPQLMKYMGDQEDARADYEGLQDQLTQLKDARDALDALRSEHTERRRREREEMERQRAIQMAQKLDILRQQKHVYLEQQRQMELQRMEELRMEMEMRLQQQKQVQHMRAMHYGYQPQAMYGGQPGLPGAPAFSPPGGSLEGSPHHQPHMYNPAAGPPPQMGMPPGAPMPGGPPVQQMPPHPANVPMTGPIPTSGYVQPGFPPGQMSQGAFPGYDPQAMYNMQGLSTALPGHPGAMPQGPPQPHQGPPPPQAYNPPPGQYPPGGMPQDQMPPQPQMQPPPPGQMPPHQGAPPQQEQQSHEAQLICFD